MIDREKLASSIALRHQLVDGDIAAIYRLIEPDEDIGSKPIKLLQICPDTAEVGIVPLIFQHKDEGYDLVMAEISPKEFKDVKAKRLPLPHGWIVGERLV